MDQRKELLLLLSEFRDRFNTSLQRLGKTSEAEFDVRIRYGAKSVESHPRTQGMILDFIAAEIMQGYLKAGLYTEGISTCSSPVFLVMKRRECSENFNMKKFRKDLKQFQPDNAKILRKIADEMYKIFKFRLVADYRRVNQLVENDRYPLPDLKTWYQRIRGMKYLSSTDLTSGFYQIPMTKQASEIYAVITKKGLFLPNRLTFGPKNGPSTQQRLLNRLIRPLDSTFGLMDDTLTASLTFKDHMIHLRKFFERLRKFNLTLNSKAKFCQPGLEFLGVIAHHLGISPKPENVIKLKNHLLPQTKTEIRSFISFARWMEDFIPHFGTRIRPITDMLAKDVAIDWNVPGRREAFMDITTAVKKNARLYHPDLRHPFYLYTDWSKKGIAAVLTQYIDSELRPIRCASRGLRPAEKNYSATEGELLAVLFGPETFKFYLLGNPFILLIDHKPLKNLKTLISGNKRINNWAVRLSPFVFQVRYVPTDEQKADFPSRYPKLFETTLKQLWQGRHTTYTHEEIKEYLLHVTAPERSQKTSKTRKHWNTLMKSFEWDSTESQIYMVKENVRKLFPSEENRQNIIRLVHGEDHLPSRDTYKKVKDRYWWPGIFKDIYDFVTHTCVECISRSKRRNFDGFIRKMNLERKALFSHWYMDYAEMPLTERGFKYVLVCVESITAYVEAFPTDIQSANHVAGSIYHLIFTYGMFKTLSSDNASQFVNKAIKKITDVFGIHHNLPLPYNPQSRGFCERYVGILKTQLERIRGKNDWDLYLTKALYLVNTAQRNHLGIYSPFQVIYGFDPDKHGIEIDVDFTTLIDSEKWYSDKAALLAQLVEGIQAQRFLEAEPKDYQGLFDLSTMELIKPGDLVFVDVSVRTRGKTKGPRYHGPFVIVEVGRWNTCKVRASNGKHFWIPLRRISKKIMRGKLENIDVRRLDHIMELEEKDQGVGDLPISTRSLCQLQTNRFTLYEDYCIDQKYYLQLENLHNGH